MVTLAMMSYNICIISGFGVSLSSMLLQPLLLLMSSAVCFIAAGTSIGKTADTKQLTLNLTENDVRCMAKDGSWQIYLKALKIRCLHCVIVQIKIPILTKMCRMLSGKCASNECSML